LAARQLIWLERTEAVHKKKAPRRLSGRFQILREGRAMTPTTSRRAQWSAGRGINSLNNLACRNQRSHAWSWLRRTPKSADTRARALVSTLKAAGVEFTNGDQPGV